ncbi:hypothetical protein DIPPA_17680 [Diplonema papillatum]|nr:hypothetical protein DIPPA_17680 [Diplonema papillatum]
MPILDDAAKKQKHEQFFNMFGQLDPRVVIDICESLQYDEEKIVDKLLEMGDGGTVFSKHDEDLAVQHAIQQQEQARRQQQNFPARQRIGEWSMDVQRLRQETQKRSQRENQDGRMRQALAEEQWEQQNAPKHRKSRTESNSSAPDVAQHQPPDVANRILLLQSGPRSSNSPPPRRHSQQSSSLTPPAVHLASDGRVNALSDRVPEHIGKWRYEQQRQTLTLVLRPTQAQEIHQTLQYRRSDLTADYYDVVDPLEDPQLFYVLQPPGVTLAAYPSRTSTDNSGRSTTDERAPPHRGDGTRMSAASSSSGQHVDPNLQNVSTKPVASPYVSAPPSLASSRPQPSAPVAGDEPEPASKHRDRDDHKPSAENGGKNKSKSGGFFSWILPRTFYDSDEEERKQPSSKHQQKRPQPQPQQQNQPQPQPQQQPQPQPKSQDLSWLPQQQSKPQQHEKPEEKQDKPQQQKPHREARTNDKRPRQGVAEGSTVKETSAYNAAPQTEDRKKAIEDPPSEENDQYAGLFGERKHGPEHSQAFDALLNTYMGSTPVAPVNVGNKTADPDPVRVWKGPSAKEDVKFDASLSASTTSKHFDSLFDRFLTEADHPKRQDSVSTDGQPLGGSRRPSADTSLNSTSVNDHDPDLDHHQNQSQSQNHGDNFKPKKSDASLHTSTKGGPKFEDLLSSFM